MKKKRNNIHLQPIQKNFGEGRNSSMPPHIASDLIIESHPYRNLPDSPDIKMKGKI